jgi:hypothetical protein
LIRYALPAVVTLALSIASLPAQTATPSLVTDPAAGHQPSLRLDGFFADRDLQRAVESGLPLRVRVRVELWKDRFIIDDLTGDQTWNAVLSYDPLEKTFRVRSFGIPSIDRQLPSYTDARAALEAARTFSLRPLSSGRYYYTATIEVETLSLSDLEELERWLQGQLKPAVSGDRSVPDAIGDGAKRLLIRVLALPTKTQEMRTPRFRVQAS